MLLDELAAYHRDGDKIVAVNNDLLDAMRHGVMCIQYARQCGLGSIHRRDRSGDWRNVYAEDQTGGSDFDLFNPSYTRDGRPLGPHGVIIGREFVGPKPRDPSLPPLPPNARPVDMISGDDEDE